MKCSEFHEQGSTKFHIMAPTLDYNTSPWSWSECSAHLLSEFVEWVNNFLGRMEINSFLINFTSRYLWDTLSRTSSLVDVWEIFGCEISNCLQLKFRQRYETFAMHKFGSSGRVLKYLYICHQSHCKSIVIAILIFDDISERRSEENFVMFFNTLPWCNVFEHISLCWGHDFQYTATCITSCFFPYIAFMSWFSTHCL